MFEQVKNSNWGGSTNIDLANKKIAYLLSEYKKINSEFTGEITHVIITDGMFNIHLYVDGTMNIILIFIIMIHQVI